VLGATVKAILQAPSRSRALAVASACVALTVGVGWLLYRFRPGAPAHTEESEAIASAAGAPGPAGSSTPEHAVGSGTDALRKSMSDTHESVRAAAVRELTATADPRILPDLIQALHDQSAAVREQAAIAIGRVGNRAALPALQQALKNRDEDEWVRLRIAQAAAALGDSDAIPVLLDLARNGDAKVTRLEAIGSLARLARLSDPPPSDPESSEGQAVLQKLDRFWTTEGKHLKFDEESRTYRP